MKLNKDELKVLRYCNKELLYGHNPSPELKIDKKTFVRILKKLEKLGLIYSKDTLADGTVVYSITIEGSNCLK